MSAVAAIVGRSDRGIDVVGWLAVAALVAVLATELAGVTGNRWAAAIQALAPYLLALSLPLLALALVTSRWALGAAAAAVAVAFVALSWPLLFPGPRAIAAADATPLRVLHANLLYTNRRGADVAATLAAADVDVIALTEYTPTFAAAMNASPLADDYPYRLEVPRRNGSGTAIWSRYPLDELANPDPRPESILAVVEAPTPVIVYAMHITSPIVDTGMWTEELALLAQWPMNDPRPMLIVGDFNASYWHPAFRRVLHHGWTDADIALGRPFAASWPDDRRPLPAVTRIDHALTDAQLVATAIRDIDIPGSDHIGFVVTVAPAA